MDYYHKLYPSCWYFKCRSNLYSACVALVSLETSCSMSEHSFPKVQLTQKHLQFGCLRFSSLAFFAETMVLHFDLQWFPGTFQIASSIFLFHPSSLPVVEQWLKSSDFSNWTQEGLGRQSQSVPPLVLRCWSSMFRLLNFYFRCDLFSKSLRCTQSQRRYSLVVLISMIWVSRLRWRSDRLRASFHLCSSRFCQQFGQTF